MTIVHARGVTLAPDSLATPMPGCEHEHTQHPNRAPGKSGDLKTLRLSDMLALSPKDSAAASAAFRQSPASI